MSITRSTQPINTTKNFPTAFTQCRGKNMKPTYNSVISRQILKFQNMQQGFQLLKISIKKQMDRRNKLKKLLDKYTQIHTHQKKHVKIIKSSIIQLKDSSAIPKLKLLIQPSILVQNRIKIQIREFLCTLMNTFYHTYSKNQKNNEIIINLNNKMSFMIKGISFNQDMIFLMQKTQINQLMQLQSQLLQQKNKIKEQGNHKKQIDGQYDAVKVVYDQIKNKYLKKKQLLANLHTKLQQLNQEIKNKKILIKNQQKLKDQCKDQIDTQILYQQKLKNQLHKYNEKYVCMNKQSNKMFKQLLGYRVQDKIYRATNGKGIKVKNTKVGEQMNKKIKFQMQCQFKSIRG